MGKMSTRMISTSSHSKTAFFLAWILGVAAAWRAETDVRARRHSKRASSLVEQMRCSQPDEANMSAVSYIQMAATSSSPLTAYHDSIPGYLGHSA